MQPYSNPLTRTVDLRHVRCRPWTRSLYAWNPERMTPLDSPHPTMANPDSTGRIINQRRLRMPPKVGRGGRCRRNSGSAREICTFGGDARVQGKRRRPRKPPGRVRTPARRIGSARGRMVIEAQRRPGARPGVAIQSLSVSLRGGDDGEQTGANTTSWRNAESLCRKWTQRRQSLGAVVDNIHLQIEFNNALANRMRLWTDPRSEAVDYDHLSAKRSK